MNIEIANRLVQLRKQNNLSQEDLASKIGISRQAVSKWERAESSPDTDNLINLAKLYSISLDELLKTDEEEYSIIEETYIEEENRQNSNKLYTIDKGYTPIKDYPQKSKISKAKLLMFPFPIVIVIIYLLSGFYFNWWHPGWILFLTIPIYYCVIPILFVELDE